MTVTGTQQRVYGTLTGGCIIDLHRFALVSGSTTDSPTTAVTVTYADTTPYKQCGYKYSGYITLFLSISGSSVYAAVEVRICKNDPKRIVIETYGEVAKVITGGMSLWFNKGSETSPDWVKLNSTTSGVIMPYATTSYTFRETKRNGSITIDCCKKCPSCGCKNCDIANRFTSSGIYSLPVNDTCCDIIILDNSYDWLSDLVGRYIYIYYYYDEGTHYRYYKSTVEEILTNSSFKISTSNYEFLGGTGLHDDALNETYNTSFDITTSILPWPTVNRRYVGPIGYYATQKLRFSFFIKILIECADYQEGPWSQEPNIDYIDIGLSTTTDYGRDGWHRVERVYTSNFEKTYENISHTTSDNGKYYLYISPEVQIKSTAPFKYRRMKCEVVLLEIIDCNQLQKPLSGTFLCIPSRQAYAQYFTVYFSDTPSVTVPSRQILPYPYDSSISGDSTILYTNNYTTAIIQYKLYCDTIEIVVKIMGQVYWTIYYRDDNNVNNLIASGFEV